MEVSSAGHDSESDGKCNFTGIRITLSYMMSVLEEIMEWASLHHYTIFPLLAVASFVSAEEAVASECSRQEADQKK